MTFFRPGLSLGTTNREIPLVPAGAPLIRASIRWTTLSTPVMVPGRDKKFFHPDILYMPSFSGNAWVVRSPRELPASGSVNAMVPCHLPRQHGRQIRFFGGFSDPKRFYEFGCPDGQPKIGGCGIIGRAQNKINAMEQERWHFFTIPFFPGKPQKSSHLFPSTFKILRTSA